MKDKKSIAFEQITELINEIDPIGLVGIAGPYEYSPEVRDILQRLSSCNSAEEAHTMVIDVIKKWFGGLIGDSAWYEGIGPKLMEIKK